MDDYPAHLAPDFNEAGGVVTPFEEWWSRVHSEFPNVPEEVARYWLHEHWRHSPYSWLRSRDYRFDLEQWESTKLWEVRSEWCRFDPTNAGCVRSAGILGPRLEQAIADAAQAGLIDRRLDDGSLVVLTARGRALAESR
jgi:hypothetical protein